MRLIARSTSGKSACILLWIHLLGSLARMADTTRDHIHDHNRLCPQ